jgi:isopenicillin N synthase-like dioxygenase
VWDHVNNKWLEVEKLVDPGKDMFVVVGRKIELFRQSKEPIFKATTHRVALPLNTQRTSLLYFLDVPS